MIDRALVVVDVQSDFCQDGALAVEGGRAVARRITDYLRRQGDGYALVVATRDWHVRPGEHISDHPDYRDSWPPHCLAGSAGARFHPGLDTSRFDAVISKGEQTGAYSGFEGHTEDGMTLDALLRGRGIHRVDLCGIATDYCVRATAIDAARSGFDVRVLEDLCAGVAPETTTAALIELRDAGIAVVRSTSADELRDAPPHVIPRPDDHPRHSRSAG